MASNQIKSQLAWYTYATPVLRKEWERGSLGLVSQAVQPIGELQVQGKTLAKKVRWRATEEATETDLWLLHTCTHTGTSTSQSAEIDWHMCLLRKGYCMTSSHFLSEIICKLLLERSSWKIAKILFIFIFSSRCFLIAFSFIATALVLVTCNSYNEDTWILPENSMSIPPQGYVILQHHGFMGQIFSFKINESLGNSPWICNIFWRRQFFSFFFFNFYF